MQIGYLVKSSLFRQKPLANDTNDIPDGFDNNPFDTAIKPETGHNLSFHRLDKDITNSTETSSDSKVSLRRERLGLCIQSTSSPLDAHDTGPLTAENLPQPNYGLQVDDNRGGLDNISDARAYHSIDSSEEVPWGGATVGASGVQWAPTSGRGKKRKKYGGESFQTHFLQPPVSKIKVEIKDDGVKWRTSAFDGGSVAGLSDSSMDRQAKFLPWVARAKGHDPNRKDIMMENPNAEPVYGNTGFQSAFDRRYPVLQPQICPPRTGGSPIEQFIVEVESDEDEEMAENVDDEAWEWDKLE